MDEETIVKAKLMSDVLCRLVDYHAVRCAQTRLANLQEAIAARPAIDKAEDNVRVALENLIDGGALE